MPGEAKSLCVDDLRHAEYYGMQPVFDELYRKSKSGEIFTNLMEIILRRENILLAYRNIKTNGGSYTAGTDNRNITDIGSRTPEEVVEKVRFIVTGSRHGYRPKPVRRKDIPKPNGKTRPLGIPCIWDRLIQQCIKQVMEPICEAQFSDNSYGFRPNRSVEHTIMRYLQYDTLQKLHLGHFDSWAASFGETVTAIELSPEGTGYRAKTRFARFFNLPELISLFKESADVQTADMLNLPVPEAEYINEVLKPSETQQEMVSSFADRAERVRNGNVDPRTDNMLKITNDGRKLALDQRLINDLLPDEPESKVNLCVENAYQVWEESTPDKSTQLIFCDLSTPKADGTFNVYDDVREKLVAKGIPREEIAFIHEANTETKKAELFAKVRSGQVRILLGSTPKLGAGTNIQDRLIALHKEEILEGVDEAVSTLERMISEERVEELLSTLTDLQRKVVHIHLFHGLSFTEAAKHLGMTRQNLTGIYNAAIYKIQKKHFRALCSC